MTNLGLPSGPVSRINLNPFTGATKDNGNKQEAEPASLPASNQARTGRTTPLTTFDDLDSVRLTLRLLDYYSYSNYLKGEDSELRYATREAIKTLGYGATVGQLLNRINGNVIARNLVCRELLGIEPQPVSEDDFWRSPLNVPLGRSDLKQTLRKADKLSFPYNSGDDVKDLLIILDFISSSRELGSLLPSPLQAAFKAGDIVSPLKQLFTSLDQNDRATLASFFEIDEALTLKNLRERALPIPDDDSDLTEDLCKVDPESCQTKSAGANQTTQPAEQTTSAADQPKAGNPHAPVFDGVFRLRFQDDKSTNDAMRTDRLRYKLGFGASVPVWPELINFKFGLITGDATSPRSPNNTDQSEVPLPRVNLALVQLAPKWKDGELSLAGGRFPMPIWLAADTVFDRDLAWDGFGLNTTLKTNDNFSVFFNAGLLPLVGGTSTSKGPYFFPLQAGIDIKSESFDLKSGLGYLGYSGLKGAPVLPFRSGVLTNDTTQLPVAKAGDTPVTVYDHTYDAVIFDYQLNLKLPGGAALAHYGEFLKTLHTPTGLDQSYTFGVILSLFDKQLTLNYSYRRLEQEATLDVNPDDDFWGKGSTDVSGHKFKLTGVYYKDKSFSVGGSFSFFRSDRINPAASNPKTTMMFDLAEVVF
jgi:Putative porin